MSRSDFALGGASIVGYAHHCGSRTDTVMTSIRLAHTVMVYHPQAPGCRSRVLRGNDSNDSISDSGGGGGSCFSVKDGLLLHRYGS